MNVLDKKIVVAGLICVDVTPVFSEAQNIDLQGLLRQGKVINTHGITVSPGGVVASTGIGLAKLGAQVHLMAKIGNDVFGEILEKELEQYNLPKTIIKSDESITSYSIVIAVPGYDRIFLHDTGMNDFLMFQELDWDVIQKACIFHFGYPQSMRGFYRKNAAELVEMYRRVKELGTATSLDMALADPEQESGKVDWYQVVRSVLPYVDIFVPSVEELSYSIDREGYHYWNNLAQERNLAFTQIVPRKYLEEMAETLMGWGAKIVMIKCGEKGMYLRTAKNSKLQEIGGGLAENLKGWENCSIHMSCFKPKQICSGTGAGDVSIAAFLYAIQRGFSARRAVELAAGAGALCVETYDTLSGIPSLDEINEKIENGWEKTEVLE